MTQEALTTVALGECRMNGRDLEPEFSAEAISLFTDGLRLCAVTKGQRVAILTEGEVFADRAKGFAAAVKRLGAEPVMVNLGGVGLQANGRLSEIGVTGLRNNTAAMDILRGVDLIIDMVLLLGSPEQVELREAGVRILLVVEPIETLKRLFPDERLRDRVVVSERLLKNAKQLRFTNAVGTDVTYDIDPERVFTAYGFSELPGRWDHWPSGMAGSIAKKSGANGMSGVNGTIVLDRGDILYPLMKPVGGLIHLEVKDGFITSISGGPDAEALSEYFRSYNDPRAYAISHIGWGLNERCEWSTELPGIGMDGRAYNGGVLFSTGPDIEFGGTNDTACHLDIPMRNCTLYLDGEKILADGEFVVRDLAA